MNAFCIPNYVVLLLLHIAYLPLIVAAVDSIIVLGSGVEINAYQVH